MSQPPMQPPLQHYQPNCAVKFTVQGNIMTSNLVPPTLTIDGQPAPTSSGGGSTIIPMMSGPHHLEVHSQWLVRYGQAALDVVVQPNSQLEVFYAPPYHQFTGGALGFTPQKRHGLSLLIGIFAVLIVIVLFVIVLAALNS